VFEGVFTLSYALATVASTLGLDLTRMWHHWQVLCALHVRHVRQTMQLTTEITNQRQSP